MPRNEKTAGITKRIRRSTKYTELCSWAISFWNEKDLERTNWELGWYKGEIQHFHEENGAIHTFYFKESSLQPACNWGFCGWDHSFNSSSSEESGIENF